MSATIIELLPFIRWQKDDSNIWKDTGFINPTTSLIWREHYCSMFKLTYFDKKTYEGTLHILTYRNPMLNVFNNKSADILKFRRK